VVSVSDQCGQCQWSVVSVVSVSGQRSLWSVVIGHCGQLWSVVSVSGQCSRCSAPVSAVKRENDKYHVNRTSRES